MNFDGFGDDTTVAVVGTFFTTSVTLADVLARKFVEPPYAAVTLLLPTARADVVKLV